MVSLTNTFQFIESNWINILFVLVLLFVCIRKAASFFKMTKEQKIASVLRLIKEEILTYMTEAEIDWKEFSKAGEVKRAQVISKVYDKFPILAKCINQEELIDKIDAMIEEEKAKLDKLMENN